MKLWVTSIASALALLVCAAGLCAAQQEARQFISALEAYKSGDYPAAVAALEAIAQNGVRNGALYYNLGNAHLKNGDLGRAILWYERSAKLIPGDPDLMFNLDYARSLSKDAADEGATPIVRIIFFWNYQLSSRTIVVLAVGGNLLFWGLAVARRFTGRRMLRRAAIVVLIPSVVFVMTAGFNFYSAANSRLGIILPERISIRSGWEQTSTELFVLHAGAKVQVVKSATDHLLIRFSKDKIGWVQRSSLGLI
jgi:tetratricopeptide (TPR) repeat protein